MRGHYRCQDGAKRKTFYARFYGPGEGLRTAEWHRHLGQDDGPGPRVPRYLGGSRGQRILLLHKERGKGLRKLLSHPDGRCNEAVERTAAALAQWHRYSPPPGLPRRSGGARSLASSLESIETLLGPSSDVRELVAELEARAPQPARAPALVHGDFYYDQVLLADDAISFLDLDELGLGDPAEDAANFCAHLDALAVSKHIEVADAANLSRRFLAGYQETAGERLAPKDFDWYYRLSLVEPRRFAVPSFRSGLAGANAIDP